MTMNMHTTICISTEAHKQIKRLAKGKSVSLKTYAEQALNYFYRTGYDPEDLTATGHSKALLGMKKQVDFLVRVIRKIEADSLRPMADSVAGIEKHLKDLGGGKVSGYPGIEPLNCPLCGRLFDGIYANDKSEIYCPSCSFSFPLSVYGIVFGTLDVYTILSGGYTRVFQLDDPQGGGRKYMRFGLNTHSRIQGVEL